MEKTTLSNPDNDIRAGAAQHDEQEIELSLRPQVLREYIGQKKVKDNLSIFIKAARARGEALDHVLLNGPPGLGKCITADSWILTGHGLVPFQSLLPNSMPADSNQPLEIEVYGLNGLETTSHIYANGLSLTRRILTNSGFELEGTPNHPVLVATSTGPQWKRLGELSTGDHVAIARGTEIWGQAQSTTWISDRPNEISQNHGKVMLAFGAKAVTAQDKVVPAAVMKGPREVVVGFLQGLFDADGNVWPDGYVEFSTRSKELIHQVQLLLANLGIIAHRREKEVVGEPMWSLFIGGEDAVRFHEQVGFRLSRKRERAKGLQKRSRGWSRSELVPYANGTLKTLLKKSQPHSRAVHKYFDHVKRNDRIPTRQHIARYLARLPESARNEPEWLILESLTNTAIYWDRVASVTESSAETFDFVVPGTHSFVANGFFNHNTTLAGIVAREMGAKIKTTAGPVIEKAGDLAALLTNLEEGDVLFIDEIHRLHPAIEEILYPAMEDFELDLMIGQGPSARSVKLDLPKFTLVGATTRPGLITAPLRGRFGINFHLDFYPAEDLQVIVERSASILNVMIDDGGARAVAARSRGTPRIANRLLRRVRDYAEVEYDGRITAEVATGALNRMEVDRYGLDEVDRKLLTTIIEKFNGGPVGVGTISAAISEDKEAIEEIYEPYLIQIGFLNRTPRGRVVTPAAYQHLGLTSAERRNSSQNDLFQ